MDREIQRQSTADHLWNIKRIVPILRVDQGLADEAEGVQVKKPMRELGAVLEKAVGKRIFGGKMRSVIKLANAGGVERVVAQQFGVGRQIMAAGLVPIIEPEVDIKCPDKTQAESLLKASIMKHLNGLGANQRVMLKLTVTLLEQDNLYADCIAHRNVLGVVVLSGGYSRDEASRRLTKHEGVTASFSRALVEGLSAQQSDPQFDEAMDVSIPAIFEASRT